MKKNTNKFLIPFLIFILVLAFTFLGFFVTANPIPPFDLQISLFLQKHHSVFADQLMLAISLFGELPYSFVLVFLVAFIFYRFNYKREAFYTLSILLSGLLILGVKNIIDRPRPTEFYVRLVEVNRFRSFPSGHVLSYLLFFGFMIVLMKHLKEIPMPIRKVVIYFSSFCMLTIPFSRVYLGAHWFSDTLGGALLGLACLILLRYFYLKPFINRNGDQT